MKWILPPQSAGAAPPLRLGATPEFPGAGSAGWQPGRPGPSGDSELLPPGYAGYSHFGPPPTTGAGARAALMQVRPFYFMSQREL